MRRLSFLLAGCSIAALAQGGIGRAHAEENPIALDEISIQGREAAAERADGPVKGFVATRSATGTKTDAPLKETPQSISVVTPDLIRATGAQTPSEALRYVAGVQAERYPSDARYDWIKVRGFDAPEYLDGMQMPKGLYGWPRYEPYGIERLEVLKGPASVLYGQTPPGGLLNFVSKKPLDQRQGEAVLSTGSYGRLQGAFDLTGPANESGTALYRVVGLGRIADTIVDTTNNDRAFIAPSVTFTPSDSTTLTLLGHYIYDKTKAVQYFPALGTLSAIPGYGKLSRSLFMGEPDFDDFTRREWAVGYEFEHKFDNGVTFRQKSRYMSVETDMPVVRNGFANGVYDAANGAYTINRLAIHYKDKAEGFTSDNQLTYDIQTGPLQHSLLVGLDYRNFDITHVGQSASFGTFDLLNPVYGADVTSLPVTASMRQNLEQTGLYAQDQIRFDRFVLLLSGRYDWVTNNTRNRLTDVRLDRDDEKFTWRAGLLYNFDNGVSPYVSYSTMFQPASGFSSATGSIGTSGGADGRPYKPTTGDQIEAGVKYQPPGTRHLFTAAVYDITQKNVLVTNATGIGYQEQVGEVRMKGFEAEAKLGFDNGWDAVAAFTYSDSEISKAAQAAVVGNRFPQTPKHQLSGFVTYAFQNQSLDGLTLGAGARYFGAHYGEQNNAIGVPSYTLVDAMARYDFGRISPKLAGVVGTITATNIFDKKYVASCVGTNSCYWGAPRTVIGSLAYRW